MSERPHYYREGRVIYRSGASRSVRVATAKTHIGAALAVRALLQGSAKWRKYLELSP